MGLLILLGGSEAAAPPADFWQALTAYAIAQTAASLGGDFSAYRDPAGAVLPYAIYAKVPADKAYDSAGSIDDGKFTVTSYAADLITAGALAAQFVAILKDPPLVFAGGALLYCRPCDGIEDGDIDPDPGPDGEDVYSSIVTARYQIDRDS